MRYNCDECGNDKKMCCCIEPGDYTYGYVAIKDNITPEISDNMSKTPSALDRQEGGDHYKTKPIQPVEYCMANGIGFMEGSVIKYVTRWRDKGGVQDLKKAKHFLELLIEYEEGPQ